METSKSRKERIRKINESKRLITMRMKIFDVVKMANDGDLYDGAIMTYKGMEYEFNGVMFVGCDNDYHFPYYSLFDSDFLEEKVDLSYVTKKEDEYLLKMPESSSYVILNKYNGEIYFRENPWLTVDEINFKFTFTLKEISGLKMFKYYKKAERIPYSKIRGF